MYMHQETENDPTTHRCSDVQVMLNQYDIPDVRGGSFQAVKLTVTIDTTINGMSAFVNVQGKMYVMSHHKQRGSCFLGSLVRRA